MILMSKSGKEVILLMTNIRLSKVVQDVVGGDTERDMNV